MPIVGFLRRSALLAGVDAALAERLSLGASVRNYERGEELWRVGEMPRALLLVRAGMVKLTRPVARGRTALCGLFGPPSCLGELVLVKGVRYQNSALAATNSQIISVPRAEILAALASEPRIAMNLLCGFEEKLTSLHDKIDVLSAGSVEARLATLLIKLYRQFGDDLDDGTSRIGFPLSRQELADMVATSFETGIRVLSRWERDGLLTTDGEGFSLRDIPAIERLANTGSDNLPSRNLDLQS